MMSGNATVFSFLYNVVYVETFELSLPYRQRGELRCTVKAPTHSNILLRRNEERLTEEYDPVATPSEQNCNDLARVSILSEELDDQFSMFYAVIHVSKNYIPSRENSILNFYSLK